MVVQGLKSQQDCARLQGHAHSRLTFRLISVKLFSEMLLVPTMVSDSKAGTEKLRGRTNENQLRRERGVQRTATRPHSLLAAAPEDPADVHRQAAEVTAVQTHPHGPVAQFTQGQGHGAEVQQTTTETHTHTQMDL